MKTSTRDSTAITRQSRVLLVGDRFLLLEALRNALHGRTLAVAVSNTDRSKLEDAVNSFRPGLVVLDASRIPAEAATRLIRSLTSDGTAVIAVCAEAISVDAARMVSAGAAGIVGLDAALGDLHFAVTRAIEGRAAMSLARRYELEQLMRVYRAEEQRRWLPFTELTERERQIFELVFDGLSADQIAEHACVSVNTVRTHIRSILAKLNVNSQLAAVALARTNNWFGSEPAFT